MTTTWNFFLLFWIAAFLLGVLTFDMTWWHVLIIIVLSNVEFSTTRTYR